MILLDSYAVVAYVKDERAAEAVERLITSESLAISAANHIEVLDRLVRVHGRSFSEAVVDCEAFGAEVLDLDRSISERAARLRVRHYHRVRRSVSLADCAAAATLLSRPNELSALATSDPALLAMVHEEGGAVHPLPQRDGSTWSPPDRRPAGQGRVRPR